MTNELVLELIKELELNTTTMWVDSLEFTLPCVVIENTILNDDPSNEEGNVHSYDKIPQGNKFTGDRIGVLIERIKESLLHPRKCDITGEGMSEGYCIQDGLAYIKYKEDFERHIKEETGYESVDEAYEDDYYYYTEWDELDDYVNYTDDGKEIFVDNKKR